MKWTVSSLTPSSAGGRYPWYSDTAWPALLWKGLSRVWENFVIFFNSEVQMIGPKLSGRWGLRQEHAGRIEQQVSGLATSILWEAGFPYLGHLANGPTCACPGFLVDHFSSLKFPFSLLFSALSLEPLLLSYICPLLRSCPPSQWK